MTAADPIRFDRDARELSRPLRIQADWGLANFTRVAGWLAHHLYFSIGRTGRCEIRTAQAFLDNVAAVSDGDVDVTILTPPAFARQALEGIGQHDRAHPHLRALAVLPHDDAILCAVPDESPIRSIGDIVEQGLAVRLATAPDDGVCNLGWLCQQILDGYGLTREAMASLGGSYLYREFPRDIPSLLLADKADAVLHEAMMVPQWWELTDARPTRFLSLDDAVLERIEAHGYRRRTVPAGRYRGQDEAITTIDYANWLVTTTEDLDDDVAYLLTSLMVEHRQSLEGQYAHLARERSPLTYPIRPDQMALGTEIPLHDGAARYFRERGLL